jgi:hypothetical protein
MRPHARRWTSRLSSALFVTALVGSAERLVAQDPYIKIREPREWQEGKPFIVPAGKAVRIEGVAYHPAGVRQILINGTPVTITPDPPLTNFEHVITAESEARTITVVIVPSTSQRFEQKFAMSPPAGSIPTRPAGDSGRAAPPRTNASTDTAQRQSVRPQTSQQGANQPRPVVPVRRSSGFKKRGWLYAVGAVGGGVLGVMTSDKSSEVCTTTNGRTDCVTRTTTEAPYRPMGFGLAGASIVIGIIDYAVSSSRSRSVAAATSDDAARASLAITAAPQGDGRVNVNLLRVRF